MADTTNRPHHRLIGWFRELRAPLRRFLLSRRGVASADIDDVAQEVFLRLLRYERAELVTDPQAYLFRIAANVASEWAMRARNRLPHDPDWLADIPGGPTPEEILERDAENRRLRDALEQLPCRVREVLRLHFAEGLHHEQIAEAMSVTRRIVKRDLINAYSVLRDLLGDSASTPKTLGAALRRTSERLP